MDSEQISNEIDTLAKRLIANGEAIPYRVWLDGANGVVRKIGCMRGLYTMDLDVRRYILDGIWVTDIESTGENVETAWTLMYGLPQPIGRERNTARKNFFKAFNFGQSLKGMPVIEDNGQNFWFSRLPRPDAVEAFHRAMCEGAPTSKERASRKQEISGQQKNNADQILKSEKTKPARLWIQSLGKPELAEFRSSPEGKTVLKLLKLGATDVHLHFDDNGTTYSNWIVVETPPAPLEAGLHRAMKSIARKMGFDFLPSPGQTLHLQKLPG